MTIYKIRLLVVKTADDDGSNAATVTEVQLQDRVNKANDIFQRAEIEFLFDPATDLISMNNTLLNRDLTLFDDPTNYTSKSEKPPHDEESHKEARRKFAQLFPDRLCVYFRHRTILKYNDTTNHWEEVGRGGSSSYFAWVVNMAGGGMGINDLAHEMGHYLQIRHPFGSAPDTVAEAADKIKNYVENNGYPVNEGLDVFDGDKVWVTDTPPDARGAIFISQGLDKCGAVGEIPIPVDFSDGSSKTYILRPDRENIMSYFKSCPGDKNISLDQARRVRDGLEQGLRINLACLKRNDFNGQITRAGSEIAGGISMVDMVNIEEGRVATAVRTREQTLKVIVWDISTSGNTITRKGDAEAGKVSDIAMCYMGLGLVATAIKDSQGNLKVIMWKVTSSGQVVRKESASAGNISEVAVCRVGIEYLATAVKDNNGKLKVIMWHVTADGGISRVGDASAGQFGLVSANDLLSSCPDGNWFVTQITDSRENLKVIAWRWDRKASKLRRVDSISAGKASLLSSIALDREVHTSVVKDGGGNLKIIAWRFNGELEVLERMADNQAGGIKSVACCRLGTELLVTAMRDRENNLRLILWEFGASGGYIGRLSFATAGGVGKIAMCSTRQNLIATAFQDRENNFKIIAWKIT